MILYDTGRYRVVEWRFVDPTKSFLKTEAIVFISCYLCILEGKLTFVRGQFENCHVHTTLIVGLSSRVPQVLLSVSLGYTGCSTFQPLNSA